MRAMTDVDWQRDAMYDGLNLKRTTRRARRLRTARAPQTTVYGAAGAHTAMGTAHAAPRPTARAPLGAPRRQSNKFAGTGPRASPLVILKEAMPRAMRQDARMGTSH